MAIYSTSLGDKICRRVAMSSMGLRQICREMGLSYSTVTRWIYTDKIYDLGVKYALAKKLQLAHIADELLEIADDSSHGAVKIVRGRRKSDSKENIARCKLRIETRKWLLAKLMPKQYGARPEEPKEEVKITIRKMPLPEHSQKVESLK
jgi:hypothetical protein